MLMRLLRELKHRTRGLVLLTATPLQTNGLELYDLLSLLGLPDEWTADDFERYFESLRQPIVPTHEFEACVTLFQATERTYGELAETRAAAMGAGGRNAPLSRVAVKTVLSALRGASSIKRRRLTPMERSAAIRILKGWTPIAALLSRHTRALLRRYKAAGKLDVRIATREVRDRLVDMSAAERNLYEATEKLITDAYANADEKKRAAVGFILTIYRKRLSSSFAALPRSLTALPPTAVKQTGRQRTALMIRASSKLTEQRLSLVVRAIRADRRSSLKQESQPLSALCSRTRAS